MNLIFDLRIYPISWHLFPNLSFNRVINIEVKSNLIKEKQDDMELSHEVASHLTKYVDDYTYKSEGNDAITLRKGEIRDSFSSMSKVEDLQQNFETLNFKANDQTNGKVKISFDVDKGKKAWLKEQINRNGGNKNFFLAIQVVLQKNQKAFLRSWKINDRI